MDEPAFRLPTHLWIAAHRRAAESQGVAVTVVHKGDADRGALVLKINQLDGCFTVLGQVREAGRLAWLRISGPIPVDEPAADALVARQRRRDPDLWVLEIEDRQGRHWFEGAVL